MLPMVEALSLPIDPFGASDIIVDALAFINPHEDSAFVHKRYYCPDDCRLVQRPHSSHQRKRQPGGEPDTFACPQMEATEARGELFFFGTASEEGVPAL